MIGKNTIRLAPTTSLLVFLALLMPFSIASVYMPLETTEILAPVEDFQLVEDGAGWVLLGNTIFWTSDSSRSWEDITPNTANTLRSAFFSDPLNGFLVDEIIRPDDRIEFRLWTTTDQGSNWESHSIDVLSLYDPFAISEAVHIQFIDPMTGWVVLKQTSSSNFNLGMVYRTTDGGQSWTSASGPSGEKVSFIDRTTGFMVGGPRLNMLFRSTDGGKSWEGIEHGLDGFDLIDLPNFMTRSIGNLAAFASSDSGTDLHILETSDLGITWVASGTVHLTDEAEKYPVTVNLGGAIQAFSFDQVFTYWQTTGDLSPEDILNPISLSEINITGTGYGWALSNKFECANPEDPSSCTTAYSMVQTQDGGKIWKPIVTPTVVVEVVKTGEPITQSREVDYHRDRTAVWQGQGFDQCQLSTLSNLQAWKTQSPLSAVNLYIGGAALGCPHQPFFNGGYIEALSIQGWKFIPTWVGPQAACTNFSARMSSNPVTAHQQGKDQAEDASRVAMKLGLGAPDRSGTVIYYDLEAFDINDSQCLTAAKAFIDGWVWKLHQYDITAGVYGSVCASGLDEFFSLDNPPDVIWPAAWVANRYNSAVSPDTLPCITNDQWGDNQRILQYSGPHKETWGNTSMYIDLDVIDGLVSDLSNYIGVPPTVLENGSFETGLIQPWEIQINEFACDWSIINNSDQAQFGNHYLAINKDPADTNCEGLDQSLTHLPVYSDRYRFAVWARSSQTGILRSLHLSLEGEGPTPEDTSQSFSGIGNEWVCLEIAHTIGQNNLTGITASINLVDSDGIDLLLDEAQVSMNTGKLCPTIPSPSNLRASDASDDQRVFVQWDSVPGATYYKIYRFTEDNPSEVLLDRVFTNRYIDLDGDPFNKFYYTVKACNAGACSKSSNPDLGYIASPFFDFFDGFEDNNLNKWDTSFNAPTFIKTCTEGNLVGAFGLCINSQMTNSAFLLKNLAAPTKNVEVIFKFDPNSVDLKNYVYNLVILIDTSSSRQPLTLQIRNAPAGYYLRISAQVDNGPQIVSEWVYLSDEPAEIMVTWWSTIGQLRTDTVFSGASLNINGQEVTELSGLVNQQLAVDRILVGGLVNSAPTGASGTYFIDNFRLFIPGNRRQGIP